MKHLKVRIVVLLKLCQLLHFGVSEINDSATVKDIIVNVSLSQHTCDKTFLSLTFGVNTVAGNWPRLNLGSLKAQKLAQALSPAFVRIGGTAADFLHFDPSRQPNIPPKTRGHTGKQMQSLHQQNLILTGERWTDVTRFCENAGWDVIFDFNVFIRKNNRWDPRKAKLLLDYSTANNISVSAFQLGNGFFYLSVLFKRLVDGAVLSVVRKPETMRVYANCASNELYPPGALVIYFVNLRNTSTVLSLSQYTHLTMDLYLLTYGDNEGLRSRYVKLNGKLLEMTGTDLPHFPPQKFKETLVSSL
ncbi:hypothetical protein Btru_041186 [Bulinus truncatus]|nr:hypothetical protein Btru_041186 [Bulinus truncatus]